MPNIKSHNTSLYYESFGSGPVIVFCHGATGNGAVWWQQVPYFAKRFQVVVFDHRGFARSPCTPDEWRPELFADDLLAILDDLSIEKANLVCQSMAGFTGMQAALKAADRVNSLVLSGTTAGIRSEGTEKVGAAIVAKIGRGEKLPVFPESFIEHECSLAFLYSQINAFNPGTIKNVFHRLGEVVVNAEQLATFKTPTLLIAGECDAQVPAQLIHEASKQIPGSVVHEMAGVGHAPYYQVPTQFNELVEGFISSCN